MHKHDMRLVMDLVINHTSDQVSCSRLDASRIDCNALKGFRGVKIIGHE